MLTGAAKVAPKTPSHLLSPVNACRLVFEPQTRLLHYFGGETRGGERDWHLAATRLRGVEMSRCQVM